MESKKELWAGKMVMSGRNLSGNIKSTHKVTTLGALAQKVMLTFTYQSSSDTSVSSDKLT